MGKWDKFRAKLLSGQADNNIGFTDLCTYLERLRFTPHIRGDHFLFSHEGVREIIDLQPEAGKAKAYQVRQVRQIINRYGLEEIDG